MAMMRRMAKNHVRSELSNVVNDLTDAVSEGIKATGGPGRLPPFGKFRLCPQDVVEMGVTLERMTLMIGIGKLLESNIRDPFERMRAEHEDGFLFEIDGMQAETTPGLEWEFVVMGPRPRNIPCQ